MARDDLGELLMLGLLLAAAGPPKKKTLRERWKFWRWVLIVPAMIGFAYVMSLICQ